MARDWIRAVCGLFERLLLCGMLDFFHSIFFALLFHVGILYRWRHGMFVRDRQIGRMMTNKKKRGQMKETSVLLIYLMIIPSICLSLPCWRSKNSKNVIFKKLTLPPFLVCRLKCFSFCPFRICNHPSQDCQRRCSDWGSRPGNPQQNSSRLEIVHGGKFCCYVHRQRKKWVVKKTRRSGQSVTASDFGSNGPRFESGRGRCVESLDKALYSHCPKEKPSH